MATKIQQPIPTSVSTQRKLSIASGILACLAFLVSGLGKTFGFEPVAEQITQVCLLFVSAFSFYFGSTTTQKITEDKKNGES